MIAAAIIIGLLAFHIVPNAAADGAIFALMTEILPPGLLGLGLASVLAIIMSTVDTSIMVGSATLIKDFYLVKKPDATEKDILRVGKMATLLFGLGGLTIAYFVQDIITLAIVSVEILLIFAPALLGGLVFKIENEQAAFWSVLLGFVTTLIFILLLSERHMAFIPGLAVSIIAYISPLIWLRFRNQNGLKIR